MQCCGNVDGQAQTLLLTRVAKTTSTWRLSALPTAQEVSDQHFENSSYSPFEIHICCGKQLAKQPGSSTNYKQFGLKAVTSQIENQPANHARSTNVHRGAHAHVETMHTV